MLCLQYLCFAMKSNKLRNNSSRILIFTPWYPNRYDSMFGLFVQRHAEIISVDESVVVIYIHGTDQKLERNFEIEVSGKDNLQEIRIYFSKKSNKGGLSGISNMIRYLRAFFKVWRFYKGNFKLPDITHVNVLTRAGLQALYLKYIHKIPYVITEHWSRYIPENNSFRGWLHKHLTKIVVKNARVVSAVSQKLMKSMKDAGLEHPNYKLVYNYVDTDLFKPPKENKKNEVIHFLHVSCFEDKSKNISGIINVIEQLKIKGYDFKMTMIGDGIDFEMIQNMISDKELNSVITCTGVLEGQALADYYQQADYQVLFSNYETFGIVIYEGFAAGLPAITTKTADFDHNLDKKKGILVDVKDQQGLFEAMKYCIEEQPEFETDYLRNYAKHYFSKDAVLQQIKDMYDSALKQGYVNQ